MRKKKILCDVILIAVLIAVGLSSYFLLQRREAGVTVTVSVDGRDVGTYPLSVDATFPLADGGNVLEIKDGVARIVSATCPGGDCVRMGGISHAGETIVCVPHKLVVRVGGDDDILYT